MTFASLRIALVCGSIALIAACLLAADAASGEMLHSLATGDAAAALHFSDLRSQFAITAILVTGISTGALVSWLYLRMISMLASDRVKRRDQLN